MIETKIDLNVYRKYNLVIPVVLLLFIKDGKVLVLERGNVRKIYYGWFEIPGGEIEKHELEPKIAALREGFEETGLRIMDASFLEAKGFPPDPVNDKYFTTWVHFYKMAFEGKIKIAAEEKDKIKSQSWMTKDQALNKKLVDWSRYAITRYM